MSNRKVEYNFKLDIFRKNPFYIRLAKEHLSIAEMETPLIDWEVASTKSNLKIPYEYLIHYNIRSIVSVNEDMSPVYGDRHTVKITFPPKYPVEAPILYMVSSAWHPNIKSEGKYKGRICGNTKGFGTGFDLYLLIMRIGEILQYKNYHAEHTPPYPEDAKVADWVKDFAEPANIVNKGLGIYTDERPLIPDNKAAEAEELEETAKAPVEASLEPVAQPEPDPEPPTPDPSAAPPEATLEATPPATDKPERAKISITSIKKGKKQKIKISKKS